MSLVFVAAPPPARDMHQNNWDRLLANDRTDDEYRDVVPIPFFPLDLPDVDFTDDGFEWTKEELDLACKRARDMLFPI